MMPLLCCIVLGNIVKSLASSVYPIAARQSFSSHYAGSCMQQCQHTLGV